MMCRNLGVQIACSSVLCDAWLKSKQFSAPQLLESFDCEHFADDCERVLRHLFSKGLCLPAPPAAAAAAADQKTAPAANAGGAASAVVLPLKSGELTAATALYWRTVCDVFSEQKKDAQLERVMPATIDIPQLITTHVTGSGDEREVFIAQQLLRLCLHVDWADESGRRSIATLMIKLLRSFETSEDLIPHITKVLRKIYFNDENGYLALMIQCMSDVRSTASTAAGSDAKSKAADQSMSEDDKSKAAARHAMELKHTSLSQSIEAWESDKAAAVEDDKTEIANQLSAVCMLCVALLLYAHRLVCI